MIIRCPECNLRVIPRPTGRCPSCNLLLVSDQTQNPESELVQETAEAVSADNPSAESLHLSVNMIARRLRSARALKSRAEMMVGIALLIYVLLPLLPVGFRLVIGICAAGAFLAGLWVLRQSGLQVPVIKIFVIQPVQLSDSSLVLHKLVPNELSFAHPVTMADHDLRVDAPRSTLSTIDGWKKRLGTFFIFGKALQVVSETDVRNLPQKLDAYYRGGVLRKMAHGGIVRIQCKNEYWKTVVHFLIDEANILLIDLSNVHGGLHPVLTYIRDKSYFQKTILISAALSVPDVAQLRYFSAMVSADSILRVTSTGKFVARREFDWRVGKILEGDEGWGRRFNRDGGRKSFAD